MDATQIAVAMHGVERIAAVFLGGISVYYGFRLFLVLPTETQSDGKIRLPGMSVVLSKAGPGLFFVAFGALVLLASLFRPIHVKTSDIDYSGMTPSASSPQAPAPKAGDKQALASVQLALQSINCMQRLASPRAKGLGADLDQAARQAKLALLAGVWDAKAWGEYGAFEKWAAGRAASTSSPARALLEANRSDCPA